jgi:PAS domain S-box-containing protein
MHHSTSLTAASGKVALEKGSAWQESEGMSAPQEPMAMLEAFSRASDAVFAVDQQMRVVFWNLAAERIFGIDESAALGRRCDEIVSGFETTGVPLCVPGCRVVGCARRGHAAETYDLVRARTDGAQQWLNVGIIVLRGQRRHSTLTVHLVRDVTERRRVEREAAQVLVNLRGADALAEMPDITRREAEVLRLLACGLSNKTIAETLGISATTVRNHIEHLLAKLGVHSKLEAVVYAAKSDLL